MATQAHLEGNRRYLEKHMTKSIRISKDKWSAVQRHYTARGFNSFAGWVQSLMDRDIASERNTERLNGIAEEPLEGQLELD